MKKISLLPLVAAMAAVAGTAQAQNIPADAGRFSGVSFSSPDKSVQLWGRVDLGLRHAPSNLTTSTATVEDDNLDSMENSSTGRWGIRGTTGALKFGLRGFFNLEQRVSYDTGTLVQDSGAASVTVTATSNQAVSPQVFRDKSYAGLVGDWGLVQFGRIPATTDFTISGRYEAFGGDSYASNGSRAANALARVDNAVFYGSPKIGPLTLSGHIGLGEDMANSGGINPYGIGVDFVTGPLSLSAGYQKDTSSSCSTVCNSTFDERNTIAVGGSFDLGAVKLLFTYGKTDKMAAADTGERTVITVGAKIPMGPGELRISASDRDDDLTNGTTFAGDTDIQRVGLGYQLPLDSNNSLNFSLVQEVSTKRFDAAGNELTDRSGTGAEVAYRLVF